MLHFEHHLGAFRRREVRSRAAVTRHPARIDAQPRRSSGTLSGSKPGPRSRTNTWSARRRPRRTRHRRRAATWRRSPSPRAPPPRAPRWGGRAAGRPPRRPRPRRRAASSTSAATASSARPGCRRRRRRRPLQPRAQLALLAPGERGHLARVVGALCISASVWSTESCRCAAISARSWERMRSGRSSVSDAGRAARSTGRRSRRAPPPRPGPPAPRRAPRSARRWPEGTPSPRRSPAPLRHPVREIAAGAAAALAAAVRTSVRLLRPARAERASRGARAPGAGGRARRRLAPDQRSARRHQHDRPHHRVGGPAARLAERGRSRLTSRRPVPSATSTAARPAVEPPRLARRGAARRDQEPGERVDHQAQPAGGGGDDEGEADEGEGSIPK